MKTYGLLGYPLGHSFSKGFFTKKFKAEGLSDHEYINFAYSEITEAVKHLRGNPEILGFNITIPHKVNILPYLDSMDPLCSAIQSCNCVKVEKGRWKGFNTDVLGFEYSLNPLLKPAHKNALVFGTGGASKAIVFVLRKLGMEVLQVSRTPGKGVASYEALSADILKTHTVWVNTTPVGLAPDSESVLPLDFNQIGSAHLVYDLIYNPEKSKLLQKAAQMGATIKNGMEMLVIQAEESWKIWKS